VSREETARKRNNLGRGLKALFGDEDPTEEIQAAGRGEGGRDRRVLPIEFLEPNPYQPRRTFDEEALASLVASIKGQGIVQPILVRPAPGRGERYQIIAGERRWRAAQRARLHEVPVVIRELTDAEAAQIAIIENVQRADLTPIEEAEGYRRLIAEFEYTQEDLARTVGKSRSHIANTLRLLDLPGDVRALVEDGKLTAGHARALLACPDPSAAARQVVERGLNVRQTEELARQGGAPRQRPRGKSAAGAAAENRVVDPDTAALEQEMSNILGLRVTITGGSGESGSLTIHYGTLEQLDDVLHRLSQGRRF
jgi:ParB family chromosome partitioning protein